MSLPLAVTVDIVGSKDLVLCYTLYCAFDGASLLNTLSSFGP
jgi:hypothetical protein